MEEKEENTSLLRTTIDYGALPDVSAGPTARLYNTLEREREVGPAA